MNNSRCKTKWIQMGFIWNKLKIMKVRYKARFVVQKFLQRLVIDCDEKNSHVLDVSIFLYLISFVTKERLNFYMMDVVQLFCMSHLIVTFTWSSSIKGWIYLMHMILDLEKTTLLDWTNPFMGYDNIETCGIVVFVNI